MKIINNIGELRANLRQRGWHMTAFSFNYKSVEYDVLFEDIDNITKTNQYASVKLHFIDIANSDRTYTMEANQRGLIIDNKKEFREFFGIAYSQNLGDVFKQFFWHFLRFVPKTAPENLNIRQNNEIDRCLASCDGHDPNAIYCYDVRRLGSHDGKQMHRSIFIANLTERRYPRLYKYFANEKEVTFYYTSDPKKEKSFNELIHQFTMHEANYNSKK